MPDLALGVTVSRPQLGLPDLDINDHVRFACATQLLGASVSWNRNQVSSPFLDGQVTTFRTRQTVNEQIAVEVRGASVGELKANIDELVTAFIQDAYTLAVVVDGAEFGYACEAADYQLSWVGSRFVARQVQVVLSVPRAPYALAGVV